MSVIICRTCGRELSIPPGQELICCPACSTINCRPQAGRCVFPRPSEGKRL